MLSKAGRSKSGFLPHLSCLEVKAKVEAKRAHGLASPLPLLLLFSSHRLRVGHFVDKVVVLQWSGNGVYELEPPLASLFLVIDRLFASRWVTLLTRKLTCDEWSIQGVFRGCDSESRWYGIEYCVTSMVVHFLLNNSAVHLE